MGKTIIVLIFILSTNLTNVRANEPKTVPATLVKKAYQNKATPTQNPILALARICVNEEGWFNKTGCAAIWQVVQNVRSKTCNKKVIPLITQCKNGKETSLSAMRRLSKRVTGLVPPTTPRQRWTSTLQPSKRPPLKWVECTSYKTVKNKRVSFPIGCHGVWKLYSEAWLEILETAKKLYQRHHEDLPCPTANAFHGPVIAWGYKGDLWLAKRRGLIQINCGDTGNFFFAKPKLRYNLQALITRSAASTPSIEQ